MPVERGDARATCAAHAPDVVVLTSLTYSRSQQLDVLKARAALGIPVAAAIMSWDHLSSKALLHVAPDVVIVWNEVQRQRGGGDARAAGRPRRAHRRAVLRPVVHAGRRSAIARRSAARWACAPTGRSCCGCTRRSARRRSRRSRCWCSAGSRRCAHSADPRLRDAGVLVRAAPRAAEGVGGHRPDALRQRGVPRPQPDRSPSASTTTSTRSITAARSSAWSRARSSKPRSSAVRC